MDDLLLRLAANTTAKRLIKTLGLPLPMPQPLRRARGPRSERELAGRTIAVAALAGGDAEIARALARGLCRAGAEIELRSPSLASAFAEPAEAWSTPVQEAWEGAGGRPLADSVDAGTRRKLDGLVVDATALGTVAQVVELFDATSPLVRALRPCARVLVIGQALSDEDSVERAAAQSALDGFVRSLAKELGRSGATANLLWVEAGAAERLDGPLRFFLSDRAAFVTAQPLIVDQRVSAAADVATWEGELRGQIALVTGAARGIGAETARRLAAEGAYVLCLDRPEDDEPLAALAHAIGGRPLFVDLVDPSAPARIVEAALQAGGLDIVVHNAGVTRDKMLANAKREVWSSVIDVNVGAVVRSTDALLADGLSDGARIIVLSSVAGLAGNVGQTSYAASKAGVVGFVDALAPLVAPRGIRVLAIAPGFIETRLTAAIPVMIREAGRRLSALGQGGQPVDVAEAITFACLPSSVGVTGGVLRVCGGALIGA